MSRRAARIDQNQPEIVNALRKVGCLVHVTSGLGGGFPDLVVAYGYTGRIRLLEVKDGAKVPSARKLTDKERDFRAVWGDYHVAIVETVEQALAAVGVV